MNPFNLGGARHNNCPVKYVSARSVHGFVKDVFNFNYFLFYF